MKALNKKATAIFNKILELAKKENGYTKINNNEGYIIRKNENNCLSGYSYKTDYFINPLFKTWENLKLVIDNLNE